MWEWKRQEPLDLQNRILEGQASLRPICKQILQHPVSTKEGRRLAHWRHWAEEGCLDRTTPLVWQELQVKCKDRPLSSKPDQQPQTQDWRKAKANAEFSFEEFWINGSKIEYTRKAKSGQRLWLRPVRRVQPGLSRQHEEPSAEAESTLQFNSDSADSPPGKGVHESQPFFCNSKLDNGIFVHCDILYHTCIIKCIQNWIWKFVTML